MNKFLNTRISVSFYNKLNTHKAFKDNWKAVSPAFYFLRRIASLQKPKDGKPISFYSETIRDMFRPYMNDDDYSYASYLIALQVLCLLVVSGTAIKGDATIRGQCKKYSVTAECLELLSDSEMEYLKALHNNKALNRRNQQSISKRKVMHKTYGDYVLDYTYDMLTHLDYDYDKAMALVNGSGWNPLKQNQALQSLVLFTEKDFTELKYNKADGRMFNDFAGMNSTLRQLFRFKNMKRKAVMDIRACYPTYLSKYLIDYHDLYFKATPIPIRHYVVDKGDRTGYNILETGFTITKEMLNKEHKQWVDLWTNENMDPRDLIGKQLNKSKEEMKPAINETINGSMKYKKVIAWFSKEYPCLFTIWWISERKKTGNNIARLYETEVMLDAELYATTERQKIKLGYEYDGMSVFTEQCINNVLVDQVNYLIKIIKHISMKRTGISPVLKVSFDV